MIFWFNSLSPIKHHIWQQQVFAGKNSMLVLGLPLLCLLQMALNYHIKYQLTSVKKKRCYPQIKAESGRPPLRHSSSDHSSGVNHWSFLSNNHTQHSI